MENPIPIIMRKFEDVAFILFLVSVQYLNDDFMKSASKVRMDRKMEYF